MQARLLIPILFSVFILSACGTLTGIPSHGGGKRFAVEQELVAASARAAVKDWIYKHYTDEKLHCTLQRWATKVQAV